MRSISLITVFLVGICSNLGSPTGNEQGALILREQQYDIIANARLLIEQLVENLRKAAKEALDAVSIFQEGLVEQVRLLQEKIAADIAKLKDRIHQALQDIYDKVANSGQAVRDCIDSHRGQAEALFNDTAKQSMACADDRITVIKEQMEIITNLANNASDYASSAIEEMRDCLETEPNNMLAVGTCLTGIAIRLEMRGAAFVTQSGLRIARLKLALATLPAALEICAGSRIIQAGVSTTKIVMGIGTCSASSIFSSLVGSSLY